MGRPFLVLAWAAILTAVGGGALALFWLLWPYGGLAMTPAVFSVDKRAVGAGELVQYTVRYCVDSGLPIPIGVDRELELQSGDGVAYAIAPAMNYQIVNRCEVRRVFLGIPDYLPPGRYHVHANTTLQVNPLRAIRQKFESETFTVTARNQ
jgi:hypothetical protein